MKNEYLQKKDKELSMNLHQYNAMIMEYQKTMNILDNTSNQLTKFRTKKMVEINDNARATYNTSSQITFKSSMLKLSLCNHGDA